MSPRTGQTIGAVLQSAARGDRDAARDLLPLVYDDLKGLAHDRLRRLRKGETIMTTDLVHDAWVRLVGHGDPGWEGRRHFYGAAARAMRNILVERMRMKGSLKREAARNERLEAQEMLVQDPPLEDALSLGEALDKLEREHVRPAEILWLRFFVGLSMPEVAELLSISLATAERDWRFARAWLQHELGREEP